MLQAIPGTSTPGHLTFGPNHALAPGSYRVECVMQSITPASGTQVTTIEVYAARTGRSIIPIKILKADDFATNGSYDRFIRFTVSDHGHDGRQQPGIPGSSDNSSEHERTTMKPHRRLLTFALATVLALFAPVGAAHAQTDGTAAGVLREGAALAACPVPGQQVKTSDSATVYLVGPNYYLYAIPGDVYFRLWDSWQPIITNDLLFVDCYYPWAPKLFSNGHLAKTSSDATVWIYDAYFGGYRGITYNAFVKYNFSWSKIRVQSSVAPRVSPLWDN